MQHDKKRRKDPFPRVHPEKVAPVVLLPTAARALVVGLAAVDREPDFHEPDDKVGKADAVQNAAPTDCREVEPVAVAAKPSAALEQHAEQVELQRADSDVFGARDTGLAVGLELAQGERRGGADHEEEPRHDKVGQSDVVPRGVVDGLGGGKGGCREEKGDVCVCVAQDSVGDFIRHMVQKENGIKKFKLSENDAFIMATARTQEHGRCSPKQTTRLMTNNHTSEAV